MCFHTFLIGGLGPDWEWLTRFGWAGVDIFFVLSGFLIGSQWLQALQSGATPSLGNFYWRRAWRILPAFAVVLGIYLAVPVLREDAQALRTLRWEAARLVLPPDVIDRSGPSLPRASQAEAWRRWRAHHVPARSSPVPSNPG